MANQSKIGIIGGGISGIAAAKQLPLVAIMSSRISLDSKGQFQFPSYKEILDYLYSYAKQFDVLKFVRFNSKWYAFEFLVICTGKYGDIPMIPKFPQDKGPEIFQGKVLHTLDYCKLNEDESTQLLKGKKVVIFGYKKSAIDLAVECAEANQGNLRRTLSKMIESYLTWKLPLNKYGLKPDHPFEEDYASCQMAILPENFFSEADKGKIAFKKAKKWWFWEGGVQFEDGTKLEADVVVLATGFDGKHKLKAIIPDPFRNDKFKLPGVEKMLEQIGKEMDIMRRTTRFYKRSCISTFSINHSDEICEEMGWKSWRKNNWISEAFSPYNSQDYEEDK
ncbi:hypothetical protein DH2020_039535 [Rehmannia glutinosa]|uniref:Flavin-containing monooxygenase n=1 Tax=Rehmannia glutinosa TaxID=99300 RepID=A0ABR0UVL2_REHGL